MENAVLGMRTLNISQGYFSNYTHKNLYQVDLTGEDTGIDTWRAKMHLKCLKILRYKDTGFANTVFFGTCDKFGNEAKVHTPGLGDVVLTLAMTHDNIISSNIQEGKVYSGDDMIYEEGTTGNATGNHIHLEIAKGWQTSKVKFLGSNYYGGMQYAMKNLVPIEKALFLLDGYNRVFNDFGYKFKWIKSIDGSDNMKLIDGLQKLNWDGSTVNAYKVFDDMKVGLMSAGDWNVVKTIDKIDDDHIHYCKINANRFIMADGTHLGVEQSFTNDFAPKQDAYLCVYKDKEGYHYCNASDYWLTKNDVDYACSPDVVLLFDGQEVRKIAKSVESNRIEMWTQQTMVMVLEDNTEVLIATSKLTLNSLINFAKSYGAKHAFAFDGGLSSQMIVNGQKIQFTGRAVPCVITAYKDSASTPSEPPKEEAVEPCKNCKVLQSKIEELENTNATLLESNKHLTEEIEEKNAILKRINELSEV